VRVECIIKFHCSQALCLWCVDKRTCITNSCVYISCNPSNRSEKGESYGVPFLDEGVGAASDSAKLAAEIVVEALEKKDYSVNVLKRYETDWDELYGDTYKATKMAEGMLESPEVLNQFIENLNINPAFRTEFYDGLVKKKKEGE